MGFGDVFEKDGNDLKDERDKIVTVEGFEISKGDGAKVTQPR